MPKDKSSSSHPCHKAGDHACRPYSRRGKGSAGNGLVEDAPAARNDWEGVICPVCMETPHNAVLLQCSSHEKGCRPYVCDTSYRHSNCFDQYLKAHLACQKTCSIRHENVDSIRGGESTLATLTSVHGEAPPQTISVHGEAPLQTSVIQSLEDTSGERNLQTLRGSSQRDLLGLLCPLCRGHVQGCVVVKTARDFLNRKVRVCAREACSFAGSYEELRAHARRDHPSVRPAEVDPARQRSWVRLERQRELGDVLSVIQSAMPHATVSGDYAIDDGEEDPVDIVDPSFLYEEGHLLTVFLLFQVFGPVHSFIGGRSFPPFRGVLRGRRRSSGSSRQGLWGEILLQNHENNETSSNAGPNDESFRERLRRHHQRRS